MRIDLATLAFVGTPAHKIREPSAMSIPETIRALGRITCTILQTRAQGQIVAGFPAMLS